MTLLQKIRSSFTTQLTLWVAGFVTVISGVVIILLAQFTQDVIREETIETTQQMLKNTALKLSNTLQQAEMTTRLEKKTFVGDKTFIGKQIKENQYLITLNQSLPTASCIVTDQPIKPGESGYMKTIINGESCFVFYEPITTSQDPISIVLSCPVKEIFGQYLRIQLFMLLTGIVGIAVLLLFCWKVIGWHLHPLHELADSAQRIADGNLNEQIADSKHQDEIGQLQNSLSIMQRSLAGYMHEMKQKHATLSMQNAQLQEAYSEAQEYENLKALFVQQMTSQMVRPVIALNKHTETVCNNYGLLTKAEMEERQAEILAATEAITALLDQLLNTPTKKRTYPIT